MQVMVKMSVVSLNDGIFKDHQEGLCLLSPPAGPHGCGPPEQNQNGLGGFCTAGLHQISNVEYNTDTQCDVRHISGQFYLLVKCIPVTYVDEKSVKS